MLMSLGLKLLMWKTEMIYFQTDIVNYWLRVEETLTEGKSLFLR